MSTLRALRIQLSEALSSARKRGVAESVLAQESARAKAKYNVKRAESPRLLRFGQSQPKALRGFGQDLSLLANAPRIHQSTVRAAPVLRRASSPDALRQPASLSRRRLASALRVMAAKLKADPGALSRSKSARKLFRRLLKPSE